MIDKSRLRQRTETTSPYLAIIGAIVIMGFGIFAFLFLLNSDTLTTDPTGYPQNQQGHIDCARLSAATEVTLIARRDGPPAKARKEFA